MEQRMSLITLGVRDVPASRRFYESLGWKAIQLEADGVAFFQLPGIVLAVYGREDLARDLGVPLGAGSGGVCLAYNGRSREEVDAVLVEAMAAGARLLREPTEAPWGGYAGYFADPEDNLWEVAWNPSCEIGADGSTRFLP